MRKPKEISSPLIDKLQNSGLTIEDNKRLKIKHLDPQETRKIIPSAPALDSFYIPYFHTNGSPSNFFRIRLVSNYSRFGVKPLRYLQPPNTVSEVYLPPLISWEDTVKDPTEPIIITEGELKAAAATKHGFAAAGLGGVWSFTKDHRLLPWFGEVSWRNRTVYIVYDNDAKSNPQVAKAQLALARRLIELEAHPRIVSLPESDVKIGLDDYLLTHSADELRSLLTLSRPLEEDLELWRMNEEYVYIRNVQRIAAINSSPPRLMTVNIFKDLEVANRFYFAPSVGKDLTPKMERRPISKAWMEWAGRATLEDVDYMPGKPKIHDNKLNTWPGWGAQPSSNPRPDVSPFLEFLGYLLEGAEPDILEWVLDWLAFPLCNPGEKLSTAVLIWGRYQGTGKSLLGYTMKRIYGQNFSEVSNREVHSNFNDWKTNKQFVMCDELRGDDKRGFYDDLKSWITNETFVINKKYQAMYIAKDSTNYYLTSNDATSLYVNQHDRRLFVWNTVAQPRPKEYYLEYIKWLDEGGASDLFRFFLDRNVPLDFRAERAPETEFREEVIEGGASDIEEWMETLRTTPKAALTVGNEPVKYRYFTPQDLFNIYAVGRNPRFSHGLITRLINTYKIPRTGKVATPQGMRRIICPYETDSKSLDQKIVRQEYYKERGLEP